MERYFYTDDMLADLYLAYATEGWDDEATLAWEADPRELAATRAYAERVGLAWPPVALPLSLMSQIILTATGRTVR